MTATESTTSDIAPSSPSLAHSRKFKAFATSFSISGPVVYCAVEYLNWPLVTYWPATNRLVWGYEAVKKGEGPNMLWYGWTVTAILIAAAIGIIAMFLPERVTNKIPLSLTWIFPILAIPYVIYALMPWWTLAFKH
ncbi:MAG: hypothetical protein WA177_01160 [Xanthobacteraceae bacterium]|jgi:hypothetical protein